MFIDLDQLDRDVIEADVCVIGSGAAGISLAREFIGSGHAVVVLEGGGRNVELDSQSPYQSDIIGMKHSGVHDGRVRAFGGTTNAWAGQALPLLALDFEHRDWVPYSGWPISQFTLAPFYRRAENVMQIEHANYDLTDWPSADLPEYDPEQIDSLYSQFAIEPNFARKYGTALQQASNIQVILHANVTSLEASGNCSTITKVEVISFNKRKLSVKAKFVVVCAGGIETARCLLLSNSVEPNGVGNRNGVVGRFFQEHPTVNIPIHPRNKKRFQNWCNSFREGNTRFGLKMVPTEQAMRAARILNICTEVRYPVDASVDAAKLLLKALRDPSKRGQFVPAVRSIARDPFKVFTAAYSHYVRGQPPSVGSTDPELGFSCEQEPNPDSRVTLSGQTDRLGLRRAVLDWRLTRAELEAVNVFGKMVEHEWRRLDVADIDLESLPKDHSAFSDVNHHIGTCRMGSNPKTSVVDSDCRVHGYHNLFIGSSATFPTGGFSNPTLTIIALCLRIADELKHQLGQSAR